MRKCLSVCVWMSSCVLFALFMGVALCVHQCI